MILSHMAHNIINAILKYRVVTPGICCYFGMFSLGRSLSSTSRLVHNFAHIDKSPAQSTGRGPHRGALTAMATPAVLYVDDRDPLIFYMPNSSWTRGGNVSDYDGTSTFSGAPGASASITFSGSVYSHSFTPYYVLTFFQ
jgi:hypothetical protein